MTSGVWIRIILGYKLEMDKRFSKEFGYVTVVHKKFGNCAPKKGCIKINMNAVG